MNLKEVAILFVKQSGRRDLMTDNWADKGAYDFIRWGQRLLDSMADTSKSDALLKRDLEAGDYLLELPGCVAVMGVCVVSTDNARSIVEHKTLDWIHNNYATIPPSDNGTPLYWADNVTVQGKFVKEIIFMPSSEAGLVLEVIGRFKSLELQKDSDKCYWSVAHPNILARAAMHELQAYYGNQAGMRAMMDSIRPVLTGVDLDQAMEQAAAVPTIKE